MSITSSSHLVPDDVARHTFGSVRRGFDPNEVRAYLESIAVGLRSIADREHELLRVLADAENRAANPVLDEATLTAAVGTETARVLHSAHEAAAEMAAKSKAEADRILAEGYQEVEQSRVQTESRLAEHTEASQAAAIELLERTNQQITAGLDAARTEAEELLSEAREQCRAMVEEAQSLRARVLADLAKRRKVLHAQIEQLRAGRERLTETVHDVRRSIDGIAEDLFAAEDNARLAAEAAGRAATGRPDEGTPEEMAAALLAEEGQAAPDVEPAPGGSGAQDDGAEGGVAPPSEAEGAPAEQAGAPGEGAGAPGDVDESPVDALFAKIRAAREEPIDEAESLAPVDDLTEQPVGPDGAGLDAGSEGSSGNGQGDEQPDGPPDDRNPIAVHRDELLDPIVTALARRLKRTLQDNQNELLDGLRSQGANWSIELLPEEVEHIDGYATAALPGLEQAAEAGVSFVGSGTAHGPRSDVLVGIAHDLAEAVVGPLRRRLSDDESGLAGAEEPVVVEHVGSAFREWKGERIERLACDHAVAAFSAGTIAAIGEEPSGQLEWVAIAGAGDAPCPDCEDNGLNGSQPPGEEFPTGHRHPPAHSGCRCLLARSST